MKQTLLFGILFTFLFTGVFAQQQVPNGDFENWETHALGFDFPTGWDTPNTDLYPADTLNVRLSNDAAHGSFSALLETILVASVFVTPGALTLGDFLVDYATNTATFEGGIPFTDRPLALKGSIKNYPAANDSSMVTVLFTKYSTTKGQRDTIGFGTKSFSETLDNWTNFSIPIYFADTVSIPDTMNIIVISSNITLPINGGHMFIDNLAFEYPAGIADIGNTVETNLFPNPASNNITFRFGEDLNAELNVYGSDGQLMLRAAVKGEELSIDVSNYVSGTYYFALIEENKKISSGQFLISR